MSSIDQRVVDMKFNNGQFESAARRSLGTLDGLKKALDFKAAGRGLSDLDAAGKKFSLESMGRSVEGLSSKFSALSIIGITALSNLANKAVDAAAQFAKGFGFEQLVAGFKEYELKMGSVQVIIANTGESLKRVSGSLEELNSYSDKTIYNFGDMTTAIGQFTSAGIKLKPAVAMIKGFSNEAARSGASAQDAARAAMQLSQGIAQGKITAQDWFSLTTAKMGNKLMQTGLQEIAVGMGVVSKKTLDAKVSQKGFKGSLQDGWLTAGVMSKYLQIMAQDNEKLNRAQLKSIGITGKQADTFIKNQKMASAAAQKVRTFTQLVGTIQESIGSSWAKTFELVIGDFNEATKLWSSVNETLGKMLTASGDQRNQMLTDWKKQDLGGQKVLIEGLTNAWEGLMSVVKPIQEAFSEIFPPATGKQLYDLTVRFRDFTKTLKIGAEGQAAIKGAFLALFGAIKVGLGILRIAGTGFLKLMEVLGAIGGVVFAAISPIRQFISTLMGGSNGGGLDNFIDKLIELRDGAIQPLIGWLDDLRDSLDVWGKSGDTTGAMTSGAQALLGMFERIKVVFADIGAFLQEAIRFAGRVGETLKASIAGAIGSTGGMLSGIWSWVKQIAGAVGGFISDMSKKGLEALKNIDPNMVLTAINTGIFAVIIIKLGQFLMTGKKLADAFASVLDGLGSALGRFGEETKADKLIKVAAAIALLAGSLYLLSLIDPNRLQSAGVGMLGVLGSMAAGMAIFSKIPMNDVEITKTSIALGLLGVAVLLFAKALLVFSGMDWESLARGLTGLAGALALMLGSAKLMSKVSGDMIKVGAGLILLGTAITIIAGAVAIFGNMDLDTLIQGGVALAGIMAMLTGFVLAVPAESVIKAGAGMVLLSVAVTALTAAVAVLGLLPMDVLIQGMVSLALVIGGLVIATQQIQNALPGAAAMVAIAIALNLLVVPIAALGLLPWQVVLQGIAALGITMAGLVFAANALQGAVVGVAGILALAGAMTIMAVAIRMLASLSLEQVGTALLALGGALLILGLASVALAPLAPEMYALAGAVALFGAGIMMVGGGIMLFSMGLMLLGPAATVGAAGLQLLGAAAASMSGQAAQITVVGGAFVTLGTGVAIVGAAVVILGAGLLLLGAGLAAVAATGLIGATALLAVVNAIKPLIWDVATISVIGVAFVTLGAGLIAAGAGALILGAGAIVMAAGLALVLAVAPGVGDAFTKFADAIVSASGKAPDLVALAIAFTVLGTAASQLVGSMAAAGSSLAQTGSGLVRVAQSAAVAIRTVTDLPTALGRAVSQVNASFQSLGSSMKTASTNVQSSLKVINSSLSTSSAAMTKSANKMATDFASAGGKLVASVKKVSGDVKSTLSSMAGSVGSSASAVGIAILNGMVRGMADSSRVISAARAVAARALAAAKSELGIRSPSKEFEKLGKYVNQGFAKGLTGNESEINDAFAKMQENLKTAISNANAMIAAEKKKINRIEDKSAKKRTKADKRQLKESKAILKQATALKVNATAASTEMTKNMKDEQLALVELSKKYDVAADALAEGNKKLEDAVKIRDDAAKNWTDKFATLEDVKFDEGEDLTSYFKNLETQIEATAKLNKDLAALRAAGLNDKVYKELVDKGLEAQDFVTQLLENGWGAISNANMLSDQLVKESTSLGTNAARELYQAGVDAAQGLVDGLKKNTDEIAAQMEKIAEVLVNTIKAKLKIKSPSKELEKIGKFTIQGMNQGLKAMIPTVEKSSRNVGESAISAMKKAMNDVGSQIDASIDMSPVITPVIDLTGVEKQSKKLDSLFDGKTLNAGVTVGRAQAVARANAKNEQLDSAAAYDSTPSLSYVQNNYSPKALSRAEIYRNTRNQLSTVKEALPR